MKNISVSLHPVDNSNWLACASLQLPEEQAGQLASNLATIAESKFETHVVLRAICRKDKVVGMLAWCQEIDEPTPEVYWLFRIMVAFDEQGKGIGRQAVELACAEMRRRGATRLRTMHRPGNHVANRLYTSLGFKTIGSLEDGDLLLEKSVNTPCRASHSDPGEHSGSRASAKEPGTKGAQPLLRPARPDDCAAWADMRAQLWPEAAENHLVAIRAFFANESIDVVECFLLETETGELVGFIELNLRNVAEGSCSAKVPYVEGWFVRAGHRGRGCGKALMAKAESWALEQGCHELASDTELHDTHSQALHARLGFEETERLVCYLKRLT